MSKNTTHWETVKPKLRDTRFDGARCNDGTPFAFQIRVSPGSKTWVIYLEGGGFCADPWSPCSDRDVTLTTTLPMPDRSVGAMPYGGPLSADPTKNPDFHAANHVRLNYCSSDFWSGSTTTRWPSSGDPVHGWYLSGHENVRATIAILRERYGLNDTDPALRVLFSGSSAGGFGAHFNVHQIVAALPNAAAAKRVQLAVDAAWMFKYDDPNHRIRLATEPDVAVWPQARAFWHATYSPICESQVVDPTECFYGAVWYPKLSAVVPTFIQQSQRDEVFGGIHGFTGTEPELDAWQAQVAAELNVVPWLFSGNFWYHTLFESDPTFHVGPLGSNVQRTLGKFWNGEAPVRVEFTP